MFVHTLFGMSQPFFYFGSEEIAAMKAFECVVSFLFSFVFKEREDKIFSLEDFFPFGQLDTSVRA